MDVHKHYCRSCRKTWEHDGDQIRDQDDNAKAHRCPYGCNSASFTKYHGYQSHDDMCRLEALVERENDDRLPWIYRAVAMEEFRAVSARLRQQARARGQIS